MFRGWMYVDYLAVPRAVVTSVDNPVNVPFTFSVNQNYPNPFNPATTIRYSIANSVRVKLVVYDLLGREISTLVDERQDAGFHDVQFNAGNLPSGVYFYRVTAGSSMQTKKMVLVK
jgi:hypothetical protein